METVLRVHTAPITTSNVSLSSHRRGAVRAIGQKHTRQVACLPSLTGRSISDNHINKLEERLVLMEMLLDSSRIVPIPANNLPSPSASNDSTIVINQDVSQNPLITVSSKPRSTVSSAIGDTTTILEEERQFGTEDSTSELRGFYHSSTNNGVEDASELGFSPPVHWIIEKADNSSAINGAFTEAGLFDPLKAATGASILPTGFKRPVHLPLSPKEELLRLVDVFFNGYNRFFPHFDPQSFMSLLERQFAGQPDKRVGWWASLNVVIAIGLFLQGPEHGGIDATGQAWGYTHNAFGAFTELTIRSTDLLSVQALLSMAVLMQGNGDPQATSMLCYLRTYAFTHFSIKAKQAWC
jgi:hypothetical protein